jgi:non-canonical (house-cleaning) NTP pyrophosphatase
MCGAANFHSRVLDSPLLAWLHRFTPLMLRVMETIVVAVGSTRKPKLGAVQEVLFQVGPKLAPGAQFEVIGREVPSGVGHTPASREETMAGARARAEALVRIARDAGERWNYFAGLEGGLEVIHGGSRRHVFLENWAYVCDGSGRASFGQSGMVPLPEALAHEVADRGVELSVAIDVFAGRHGIRDAEGAWGVLTANTITRQDAFRIAFINAFAPFFNSGVYLR